MPKPLRILHILPSLSPETGGPAKSVMRLFQASANVGNILTLYSTMWPKRGQSGSSHLSADNGGSLTIKLFPSKPHSLIPNLPYSPGLLKAVHDHDQQGKLDMVVNHSLWNPVATFAMRILREAGKKYCIMPHGMLDPVVFRRRRWKKSPWALLWERANVEEASLIIFNTESEREKARRCGWHLRETFIFPHIIDLPAWKILPSRSVFETRYPQVRGCEVILFVGRINWVKNLDKLVDALVGVRQKRPSAMLVCVGPDSDGHRAKLEKQAKTLGLQRHLLFTSILEGEELKAAYARGDVLTLVSQKENFGLTVAEALACGLPVVVSEGVDLGRDWVSQGPVRRVPPMPEKISEALIELLERSASRGLPDVEARALAEREWGESKILALIDTYRRILAQKKK